VNEELAKRIDEFQRCIAERDATAVVDVLDDDYALVLVQPEALTVTRQQWLDTLPDYVVHSYEVQEQTVDVDDDCAAVLQRVHMSALVHGQDRSGVFVLTDIWRRRDNRWRVWRRHSTPLSAGEMPEEIA
jgi:ketosteroid isomerase-like protein